MPESEKRSNDPYDKPGIEESRAPGKNDLRKKEEGATPQNDDFYRPTGNEPGIGSSPSHSPGINSSNNEKTPGHRQVSSDGKLGNGFTKATQKQSVFWRYGKKRTLFSGGVLGTIVGIFLMLSTLSGPAEFIQLSHVLQRNMAGNEHTSHIRMNGLYRYAKSGDIGETRVGRVGSKIFGNTQDKLKDIGIEFQRNSSGRVVSTTIDTEKLQKAYPEMKNMSEAERKSFLASKFDLNESDLVKISDINGPKFAINTRDFGINATRALVNNSLSKLNDGKIATAVNSRVVSKYLDIPSLLHPLSRAKATIKDKLSVKAERAARAKAEEDRLKALQKPAETPEALSARSKVKNAVKDNEGKVASILIAQAGLCAVRSIADDAIVFNRTAIVLPATAQAADKIAIGEQIQSGQDFDISQLGPVKDTFKDSNGKSIWASPALQATAGTAAITSGPELLKASAPYEQAFSGNTTADKIRQAVTMKVAGVDVSGVACSTVGLVVGGVAGVAFIVAGLPTGGASWGGYVALKGAEFAATAGVMYMLQQQLEPLVRDNAIVPNVLSGPLGGNIIAYGAREMGNVVARSNGGVDLKGSDTTVVSTAVQQEEDRQFASKSPVAKLFDIHDYRSVAGRMIDNFSPSPKDNLAKMAAAIFNFKNIINAVVLPFNHRVAATATTYNWGFDRYGIPDSLATDQRYENPYDNATYVASHLLDNGTYIDKARICFGVSINKDANGKWQVQPSGDVNPDSTEYGSANCNDTNEDWQRMMLFVFDSRTMDAAACYAGDEDSCSLSNIDSSSVTTTTSEPTSAPNGSFQIKKLANPLHTPGGKITPKGITLHWWGSGSNGQGINALVSALRGNSTCPGGCSVQVGITADGKVYQMTNDLLDLTWHAIGGNQTTIGVEIEGGPSDFGQAGITKYPAKFQAVVDTVKYLSNKYNIPLDGPVNCGDVVGVHPHKAYNNCPGADFKEDIDDAYFNAVMQQARAK